jgi:hypothetical protein
MKQNSSWYLNNFYITMVIQDSPLFLDFHSTYIIFQFRHDTYL